MTSTGVAEASREKGSIQQGQCQNCDEAVDGWYSIGGISCTNGFGWDHTNRATGGAFGIQGQTSFPKLVLYL